MLHDQSSLMAIVQAEIEDRHVEGDVVRQEECDALREILTAISSHAPLTANQYVWLCDLVTTATLFEDIE